MAFKLRRGTDAQRLGITPAEGELIYTTDTKELYVGDGSTVGGVAVDTGTVSFTGVASNITPDANNTRTLGTSALRWNNGFFTNVNASGTVTAAITGNVTGNLTGNVTGNVTGNLTGDVSGDVSGDLKGSVFGDDSTVMVDGITKRIKADIYDTAGTLLLSTNPATDYFSNGSVVIQNNVVTVTGALDTVQIGVNDSANGVGLRIKAPVLTNKSIRVSALTDGVSSDAIEIEASRGTLNVPTILTQGDPIGGMTFLGYDGTAYRVSSGLFASVEADSGNPVAPGAVPGTVGFFTTPDGGTTTFTAILDSFGNFGIGTATPTQRLSVEESIALQVDNIERVKISILDGSYTQAVSSTAETYTAFEYPHALYRSAKVTLRVHYSANDTFIGEFLIVNTAAAASIATIQSTFNGTNSVSTVTVDVSGANVRLRVTTPATFAAGTGFAFDVLAHQFVKFV